jgi:hypothetical protein
MTDGREAEAEARVHEVPEEPVAKAVLHDASAVATVAACPVLRCARRRSEGIGGPPVSHLRVAPEHRTR